MDTVIRAAFVYVVLLTIFRIAGKRSLADITTFDLVLTLIISEAISQGMVDDDQSLFGAFLLVITLVGLDVLLSLLKQRSPRLERVLEGSPAIVLKHGKILRNAANKERVDEAEILSAARRSHGLKTLEDIEFAVVERSGGISIVPTEEAR